LITDSIMKKTKKQKQRHKEAKRRQADDRRYEVIERLLDLFGLKSIFSPIDWVPKSAIMFVIAPRLDVDISECSKDDPEIESIKALFEWAVATPLRFSLEGHVCEVSLDDLYRGLFTVRDLVYFVCEHGPERKDPVKPAMLERLEESKRQMAHFEKQHLHAVFSRLTHQLTRAADLFLRIDERIVWYRIEHNGRYPERPAFRIVVGRKRPLPVSLPVAEGRRKAYACERTRGLTGVPRQLLWNPTKLGIGSNDRDLPVFVSEHAIRRLHERIPVVLDHTVLHRTMCEALAWPELHPAEGVEAFLVAAGEPERKVGYFVVELYPDFVFVKTFLFLTMQGTPEAKCLRRKLGLSRRDIEYFKLDHFFTLACSDLGDDPELRRALAECGCDYLLDFSDPEGRLSWLKRYRDPLRQELGLPVEGASFADQVPDESGSIEIESMIEYCQKAMKRNEGWTF
jgi:hypothetical protein